jgi:hypothetical protein
MTSGADAGSLAVLPLVGVDGVEVAGVASSVTLESDTCAAVRIGGMRRGRNV